MSVYLDKQMQEALGPVNKWYCSQFMGYEVTDPELLLTYYIKHGGASQFRMHHTNDFDASKSASLGLVHG